MPKHNKQVTKVANLVSILPNFFVIEYCIHQFGKVEVIGWSRLTTNSLNHEQTTDASNFHSCMAVTLVRESELTGAKCLVHTYFVGKCKAAVKV